MLIPESEQRDFLIYAFRYALGRRSYAVWSVADAIKRSWPELSNHDKELYRREIDDAIENDFAGDKQDIETWQEILKLPAGNEI